MDNSQVKSFITSNLELIKKNIGALYVIIVLFLSIIFYFSSNHEFLFILMCLILVNNFTFGLQNIKNHIVFTLFHGSFALFLCGRFFATALFNYDGKNYNGLYEFNFSINLVVFIQLMIIVSLILIFISYIRSCYKEKTYNGSYKLLLKYPISMFNFSFLKLNYGFYENKFLNKQIVNSNRKYITNKDKSITFKDVLRIVSLFLFVITVFFQIVSVIDLINYTKQVGYHESYLKPSNSIPNIFRTIGSMYEISLFSYLILKPKSKNVLIPIMLYLLIGILFLMAGRRKEFMLSVLIVVVYLIIRYGFDKISCKKLISISIISIVLLFLVIYIAGEMRIASDESKGIINSFSKVLFDQGISARTIGYASQYKSKLPAWKFYSFGTVIEFIKYKIIGGIFQGNPVPVGQTISRAINGHLFSLAISWEAIPQLYLKGVGVGSSYIAELFVDFGIIGVVLGNIFFGKLIRKFNKILILDNYIPGLFTLLMVRGFFFTPRSSFTSYLTNAFSLKQMLAILFIILVSIIVSLVLSFNTNKRKRIV